MYRLKILTFVCTEITFKEWAKAIIVAKFSALDMRLLAMKSYVAVSKLCVQRAYYLISPRKNNTRFESTHSMWYLHAFVCRCACITKSAPRTVTNCQPHEHKAKSMRTHTLAQRVALSCNIVQCYQYASLTCMQRRSKGRHKHSRIGLSSHLRILFFPLLISVSLNSCGGGCARSHRNIYFTLTCLTLTLCLRWTSLNSLSST